MKSADYKCIKCDCIREITVYHGNGFPDSIPCLKCGDVCRRIFSAPGVICHQGKAGNSKNGYTSNKVPIKKS